MLQRPSVRIQLWAILLLAFVAYLPVLKAGFVYDDHFFIAGNSHLQTLRNIPDFFLRPQHTLADDIVWDDIFRPLRTTSFALDYFVWKLNPLGYHLSSLGLHLLTVLLVFLFLSKFLESEAALWGTALFALHPVNVEAVAWISSRADVLCAPLYLGAFLCYVRSRRTEAGGQGLRLFSWSLFLLAALAKEVALTLPLVLLVWEALFGSKRAEQSSGAFSRYRFLIPFFATAVIYAAIWMGVLGRTSQRTWHGGTPWTNLATAYYAWARAFSLLLMPLGLAPDHPVPPITGIEPRLWVGLGFAGFLLFCVADRLRRGDRIAVFLIAFSFLVYLPTSSLVPLNALVAERFLYLPLIGLAGLLGRYLWDKGKQGPQYVGVLLVCVLGALTLAQAAVWRNDAQLWDSALQAEPQSFAAHFNTGIRLKGAGAYSAALAHLRKAVALEPDNAHAHYYLGSDYMQEGNLGAAERHYERALQLVPDYANVLFDFGVLRWKQGDLVEARKIFEELHQAYPENQTVTCYLQHTGNPPQPGTGLSNPLQHSGLREVRPPIAVHHR
ncbi:MAG: tetratricopeptide repeat protein [Candidatus Omnitrophica bacterium]|nr:tetratricopeptide repeat protein [Candidatus Omnitrophota bacterium]